jgi:hypothetical protein
MMELYGFGDLILIPRQERIGYLLMQSQIKHSQKEPTGNKFLVVVNTQQQSRLMEPYGVGD